MKPNIKQRLSCFERSGEVGQLVLVGYLCCAFLFSILHLAFANHSHRYSPSLAKFVDIKVVGSRSDLRDVQLPDGDERQWSPTTAYGAVLATCVVSSGILLNAVDSTGRSTVAQQPSQPRRGPTGWGLGAEPLEVLQLAPKHSPPLTGN